MAWGLQYGAYPEGVVRVSICGGAKRARGGCGVGEMLAVGSPHAASLKVAQVVCILGFFTAAVLSSLFGSKLEVGMVIALESLLVGLCAGEVLSIGVADACAHNSLSIWHGALSNVERWAGLAVG